jgi:hypothetical protein
MILRFDDRIVSGLTIAGVFREVPAPNRAEPSAAKPQPKKKQDIHHEGREDHEVEGTEM